MIVVWLFLTVPQVYLQFVIVVFTDYNVHSLFLEKWDLYFVIYTLYSRIIFQIHYKKDLKKLIILVAFNFQIHL